jgi:hypothetical protein
LNYDNKYRMQEYRIAGLMSGLGAGIVVVEGGVDVGQLTATHSWATPRLPSFTQTDHPPKSIHPFALRHTFQKSRASNTRGMI